MQDRYAGDIGDFGKIGLLKALVAQGLSVGVNWYYVEPLNAEKNVDGTFKRDDGRYRIPESLQVCDKDLAEKLIKISKSEIRSIKELKKENLIPNAIYYSEPVTVARRAEWHKKALEVLKDLDIVFVDPDNGMLVKSVGKGSAKSIKYTFYEEVQDYFQRGQSVLIYNHRCRKPEYQYFHEICCKLQEFTNVNETEILKISFPKYSVRDYLAVPASTDHREKIMAAFIAIKQGLWGETGMCRIPGWED